MFVREKRVGKYTYLQLVENYREGGKVRQRVLCTLGRVDRLAERGGVDAVILSLAKFAEGVQVQEAYREGDISGLGERVVGPTLVFGRLWEELGLGGFPARRARSGGSPRLGEGGTLLAHTELSGQAYQGFRAAVESVVNTSLDSP